MMLKYTELKSTNRQNLRNIIPLAKPFTVLIEPTSLCNFRCVQCFQSVKTESYFTRNRRHMPLELYRKVIDQLVSWPGPKIKVLKLSLYGEPLANPQFAEMMHIAREAGIAERIETTTNASLLTRKIAEQMVDCQLDYARVSIYATSQDKFGSVTGSSLDLGIIQKNLRVLQEVKRERGSERPFVSCKMLDSYGEENQDFLALFAPLANEVYIDKPHGWIKPDGVDFVKNYYEQDLSKALEDCKQLSSGREACPMAFTTMAVRSNGEVSPCCVDYIGGTNLGNVADNTLQELWRGDRWIDFQTMQLENRKNENSSCARCDIYLNDHYTRDNIDGFPVEKLR